MKSNRRDFLKTTAATGATVAALDAQAALAPVAPPEAPAALDSRQALRLSLHGVPAAARAASRAELERVAKAAGTTLRRLDVQVLAQAPTPWPAEDIALVTKYAPAPDGVALDFPVLAGASAALPSYEQYWSGRRNAVAIGIEPYAMLVHKAKAAQAGIGTPTLAAFVEQGVKPRLPLSLDLATGDNGWIHPLFAEYTGWHERPVTDAAGLFLDAQARQGMHRLRQLLIDQVDASLAPSGAAVIDELIDEARPQAVAAYGNPLLLAARLTALGRDASDFEAVSLQRFMNLRTPSLFRVAAVQLGSRVQRREAPEVMARLARPKAAAALLALAPHLAPLDAPLLALLPHDHGFHARLPFLNVLADARVMTALALNLRLPAGHADPALAAEQRVLHAASEAFYELADYAAREQQAYAVSAAAAPAFRLA